MKTFCVMTLLIGSIFTVNGEIIVVSSAFAEVGFEVSLDTASVLGKKDALELINLSGNALVTSKLRGSAFSGSIQLYIIYILGRHYFKLNVENK